ncbi:4-carboxymuconolactone decarboxylase [Nocardioides sp.]|uniref:bifunctional 3-oxoadipate enol-lactonase/4-carboxymuconolactone decarboxylase PcaDC n=1 Tax=Nocardioides sp. TaxID=35761 RepID=UPI003D13749F
MTVPALTATRLAGTADLPLLVCGPSLGTSAVALWSAAAELLGDRFHVVGWDLPGHGSSAPRQEPFTIADLAAAVLTLVDDLGSGPFAYAGDSVGGAVGLQLLLDAPERVSAAVILCSGARIGTPEMWQERAATVRASGTPVMVESSAQRWFAPGFIERQPVVSTTLLHALQQADRLGYAATCDALAEFDVRDRLGEITAPVLAVAGEHDVATPVDLLGELVSGLQHGRLVVLPDVAHLAPAEAPAAVASLIREHVPPVTLAERRAAGMAVRRAVLGEGYVDRASAAATDFTREFQEFITDYAWGGIWTRPGLDRRSRSLITLTALVARGHHEELELHLRAARANGLSDDEIKELLLQCAVYCGVPDANTAFRIAQRVLAEGREA